MIEKIVTVLIFIAAGAVMGNVVGIIGDLARKMLAMRAKRSKALADTENVR